MWNSSSPADALGSGMRLASGGRRYSRPVRRSAKAAFQSQCHSTLSPAVLSDPGEAPPPDEVDLLLKGGHAAVWERVRSPPQPEEDEDVQADVRLLDISRGELEEDAELCSNTVLLHVYDLGEGLLKTANDVLAFSSDRMAVGGAFHVGVEVFGSEWSYGCHGVCSALPRAATGHIYRCSIYLRNTGIKEPRFVGLLYQMCQEWRGSDYHVSGHNCCSFASELCDRLAVGPMPPWINRFARSVDVVHRAGVDALEVGWETSRIVHQVSVAASEVICRDASKFLEHATGGALATLSGLWEHVVEGAQQHISLGAICAEDDDNDPRSSSWQKRKVRSVHVASRSQLGPLGSLV